MNILFIFLVYTFTFSPSRGKKVYIWREERSQVDSEREETSEEKAWKCLA